MSNALHPSQGRLLGVLARVAVERLGGNAMLFDADRVRELRMARVDDIAVVDQPADDAGPRVINVYHAPVVEGERAFRIDPSRLLYSLAWLHKATPPDFHLHLVRDPAIWFDAVTLTLITALAKSDPALCDALRACFAPAQ